jgi:CrcB protein
MNWALVFIGGGMGSLLRYAIGLASAKVFSINFPLGTFLSNILACLLLGALVYGISSKMAEYPWLQPLLVIGFCGGFSTFSSFSNETLTLFSMGNYTLAIVNILVSLLAGISILYGWKIVHN